VLMLLSGAREGIFEGLRVWLPAAVAGRAVEGWGFVFLPIVPPPAGVFGRIVEGPRIVSGAGFCADAAVAGLTAGRGGSPFGVFARGGGARAAAADNTSRYRSPKTRKGRPYSSSHCSSTCSSSCCTFGKSFAIRFLIFSSRSSRVGSRRSPFWPFPSSREASWLAAARSSRSLMSERCLSISCNVGARCSFSASRRSISASCAERRASL